MSDRFNAIPLYELVTDAANKHKDEIVRMLESYDAHTMAMEASQGAMVGAGYVETLPYAAADALEKSALIALSLTKKLRKDAGQ